MSDENELSELRKCEYRNLLDQIEIINENEETGSQAAATVNNVLLQADKLFGDRNSEEANVRTDEMLLDAKVVAITSNVLYNVTEAIDCAYDTYDPSEFARRIISKLSLQEDDDTEFNWSLLFKESNKILKFPPNLRYMYGPVGKNIDESKVPKKIAGPKPKRQKINRQENADKKQPEKITTTQSEEDSVTDTVQFMYYCLRKEYKANGENPVEYMVFLIDPTDFSTTIQNMFHMSFLVRDGRVNLTYDDDGLLVLAPITNNEIKKTKTNKIFKQSIISIDMAEWKKLIEVFQIKESVITKWKKMKEKQK